MAPTELVAGPAAYLEGEVARLETQELANYKFFREFNRWMEAVRLVYIPVSNSDCDEEPTNIPPVANAGPDQTVTAGTTVSLSGARSSDPDGRVVSYAWTQIEPPSIHVILTGTNTVNASFPAPNALAGNTVVFRLTVTDDDGATHQDTVRVTIRPAPTDNSRPGPMPGAT